ncbi:hypothetical protein A3D88_00175 [Candidatus Peribacteria bacterium RIFCSPHIGHO2_02_FULL_52_16]|nr:MAG: hypothetical protein A2706_01155 [Candidatus Peribacteria bacterium RIFCSPHIGHO2_01_FULL_51_35]OGJ61540.1 MAG: hypothetical protein A3D88_00175 [Candidatus Peribacteria bacterium RIFCSPHIGHO2_02_FULL_52_16]
MVTVISLEREWPKGPEGRRAQELATNPVGMTDRDLPWALAEDACRTKNKKPASCPLVAYLLQQKTVAIQDGCRACLADAEEDLEARFSDRQIEMREA